jgi:hypothetical protein
MTDPFGQVRSRVCQLAVMVSVTVMPVLELLIPVTWPIRTEAARIREVLW